MKELPAMQQGLYKKLIINNVSSETKDVKLFYFTPDANSRIDYKSGQYLTFIFDGENGARRSYSIASSPVLREPLSIGVKRISNGQYSRKLFDHTLPGDSLLTLGAAGMFTLPEDIFLYKQFFFFAAGSGIIPIYSLIKTILHSFPKIDIVLIYSNSSIENTVFYHSLKDLKTTFPTKFRIKFLFSNAGNLFEAHLHADLILLSLQNFATDDFRKALYYVCGPEVYMRLCTYTFQSLHIPAENIKKEIFHSTRPVYKAEPPDKTQHKVSIIMNTDQYILNVQYPVTILQAAKNQGIVLPYSCETGRCGNCIASCISGKIWMSYNEILTEKELEQGLILTCTAFPVNGDATIRVN